MNFLMGAHEILMYLVGFVFIMFCNIIVYMVLSDTLFVLFILGQSLVIKTVIA